MEKHVLCELYPAVMIRPFGLIQSENYYIGFFNPGPNGNSFKFGT